MTPGIHSLSFEAYLAAAGVSDSMLKLLGSKSPAHLRAQMNGETEREESPALRFGTEAHRALFEPETMDGAFHVKPDGMKFSTKDGMAWRDAHQDKPILTADEARNLTGVVKAVHAHPVASRLLKNAEFERSLFVEDDMGTLRKLRPDILPNAGNIIPDLKTVEDASEAAFSRSLSNFGWYRKAAYYLDGCALLGREFESFVLIAVEKAPPYAVAVYNVDPAAIELGRREYQRDLVIYRECLLSGKWPGYPERVQCVSLPIWRQKELEAAG